MKRSKVSLSHYRLQTMDMGELIPLTWYEALPGDTIQHRVSALVRCAPLIAPVMHPVVVRIHNWFVPNRLIWEEWEDFITGGPDGTSAPVHPFRTINSDEPAGLLPDYMGVPPNDYSVAPIDVSVLPFRAYQLIYNEYYRDQDLIAEVPVATTSGEDNITSLGIRKVSWEKDYFTTSRPWEQKGVQVTIPIGDTAEITPAASTPTFKGSTNADPVGQLIAKAANREADWQLQGTADQAVEWDDPGLVADLSTATGISVNDLRLSLAIQRYQEARAQYGSRYVEYLRYLGVRSSDARLQNPEFISGSRQIIQFSEVLKHHEIDDALEPGGKPLGFMGGHGITAMQSRRYRRFFEEHGIVMSLMSVVPKAMYKQAMHRKWNRQVKEDYFQRELQYLGEQEVTNFEASSSHTLPDDVFGYQQRYDEYRHHHSEVAGDFNDILNYWHLAREFSGDVALNQSYIECNPSKRIFADQTSDGLYVMANHSIQARRLMARNPKPRTF